MFAQIFTSLLKYCQQEETFSLEAGLPRSCRKTRIWFGEEISFKQQTFLKAYDFV